MILNSSDSATHGGDQGPDPSKPVDRPAYSSGPFPSWPSSSSDEPNWNGAPIYKKLLFGVIFLVAFSLLDRSSTLSQGWAGSPTWYLPVGLVMAAVVRRHAARALDIRFHSGRGRGELPSAHFFVVRNSGRDSRVCRLHGRRSHTQRAMAHRSQARRFAGGWAICCGSTYRGSPQRLYRNADSRGRPPSPSVPWPEGYGELVGQ